MRYIDPAPSRPSSALGLETAVRARGRGIIILSGPSSCGKGAIAAQLRKTLHLPPENHISMGEALRETIQRAREDAAFHGDLGENFGIWPDRSIYDPEYSDEGLIEKAKTYDSELQERYEAVCYGGEAIASSECQETAQKIHQLLES